MATSSYFPTSKLHQVPDQAFEPDPEFAFEDASDDFSGDMPGLASTDFYSDQSAQTSHAGTRQSHKASSKSASHAHRNLQGHVPPEVQWRQAIPSPVQHTGQTAFQVPPSFSRNHSAISQTASQHFGQITPPEDGINPVSPRQEDSSAHAPESASRLTKSERARNAANQRHAKVKKVKAEPLGTSQSDGRAGANGLGTDEKKEKYREKNRAAAAKCRAKKKESTDNLEDVHRAFSARSKLLRREEQQLREELLQLKSKALQHTHCSCGQIHQYNARQARFYAESGGAVHNRSMSLSGQEQCSWLDAGGSPSFLNTMDSPESASSFDFSAMSTMPEMQHSMATCGDHMMPDFFQHDTPAV
ncbi:hypothetical protein K431DRAFT_301552 [Polychaeton citri CBS 116435]|uniref:BZIP domain-containing protein n=1 Tax=Polychaeton citri CBS 116435 TaxID=1314669 RepID=A0A9P4QEW9_9PEZI|nr:hypothetical protein K431DRAFT_301552 [Polychaeton citri CBS 116435]